MGQGSSTSRADSGRSEAPPGRSNIASTTSDVDHRYVDTTPSEDREHLRARRLRRRTRNPISQGPGSLLGTLPHDEQALVRSALLLQRQTLDMAGLHQNQSASTDSSSSFNRQDLNEAGTPDDSIAAGLPASRQSSYMTRMASRLLPRYSTANSTDTEDDGREEGRAVRRRLSDRFSIAGDPRFESPLRSARSRTPLALPRQYPDTSIASVADSTSENPDSQGDLVGALPVEPPTSASGPALFSPRPLTARSRFSSLRNSIHLSLNRFGTPSDRASILHDADSPSEHQRSRVPAETSDTFLPPLPTPNLGLDIDPARVMTPLRVTNPTTARPPTPPPRLLTPPPPSERDIRRLPHALRGGPTRPRPGEDQAAMLSRLLSHAAALTAVSLVGDNQHALSDARDVGGDNVDGSFEGFLQALQNGRLAAALRNGGSEMGGGSAAAGGEANVTPVNFFRMFRFGTIGGNNSANTNNRNSTPTGRRLRRHQQQQQQQQTAASEAPNEEDESRMVPVIIVGIRSMTSEEGAEREGGNMTPPFFDMLQDLAMEDEAPRGRAGGFLRRTDGRSRFSRPRRPSLSSTFPANYDSQRHHRGNTMSSTASQTDSLPTTGTSLMSLPTVLSDTPPGPHPPPSTPADHSLSALSSGSTTPNRQPSISSAGHTPGSPSHLRDMGNRRQNAAFEPTEEESHASARNLRRRRLSDSEFSRYRNYGLGSSRRNGIVGDSGPSIEGFENDGARSRRGQPETTNRSWIIYVLGGSYPEDHPILTTPSLFTDSPSYEDMLLLATLLGPAKPPVASEEDVASAPGLFRVDATSNALVSIPFDGQSERLDIPAGDRCLVCLSDYEAEEEVRKLNKCGHFFHRECIDEWLTTGRNSCPLCRSQGVDEKKAEETPTVPAATAASNAEGGNADWMAT